MKGLITSIFLFLSFFSNAQEYRYEEGRHQFSDKAAKVLYSADATNEPLRILVDSLYQVIERKDLQKEMLERELGFKDERNALTQQILDKQIIKNDSLLSVVKLIPQSLKDNSEGIKRMNAELKIARLKNILIPSGAAIATAVIINLITK